MEEGEGFGINLIEKPGTGWITMPLFLGTRFNDKVTKKFYNGNDHFGFGGAKRRILPESLIRISQDYHCRSINIYTGGNGTAIKSCYGKSRFLKDPRKLKTNKNFRDAIDSGVKGLDKLMTVLSKMGRNLQYIR